MQLGAINYVHHVAEKRKAEEAKKDKRLRKALRRQLTLPFTDRSKEKRISSDVSESPEAIERSLGRIKRMVAGGRALGGLVNEMELSEEQEKFLKGFLEDLPLKEDWEEHAREVHLKFVKIRLERKERRRMSKSHLNERRTYREDNDLGVGLFGKLKNLKQEPKVDQAQKSEEKPGPNLSNKLVSAFALNARQQRRPSSMLRDTQFIVQDKIIEHKVKKSLGLFTNQSRLRKIMVNVSLDPRFNTLIMVIIFLNCIAIGFYDHSEQNKPLNRISDFISNAFTAFYIIEAIIKIIADGFVMVPGTYLRDPTNIFDFVIVVGSIVAFSIDGRIEKSQALQTFFRILRTLRVFKLLAGFQKVPVLRKQIVTLGRALKGLANVGVFLLFFFVLLAIFGLQLFSEDIYNACRLTPEPIKVNGELVWPRAPSDSLATNAGICSKQTSWFSIGGYTCPEEQTCGSYLDYGLPLEKDGTRDNYWLNYDIGSWRHMGTAMMQVFQIITQDSWSMNMYTLIYATEFVLPVFFGFTVNLMGTYFLMNLMLAVILDEYIKSEQAYQEEMKERQEQERAKLKQKYFQHNLLKDISQLQQLKDKSQNNSKLESISESDESSSSDSDSLNSEEEEEKSLAPVNQPSFGNNLLLQKMKTKMTFMLTEKQKELEKLQGQIDKIQDNKLRQRLSVLQNVLAKVTDENQEKDIKDKMQLVEEMEEEQNFIVKDLQRTVHENILESRKANTLKNEDQINAWVQKELTKGSSQTGLDAIAMKMKQKYLQENQTEPNSEDKVTKTKESAQNMENAKLLFKNQKAFLKREILEQRANGNYVIESCLAIDNSKLFNLFIAACIIGNTIVLALDKFPNDVRSQLNDEFVNFIFYLIFIAEMVIKMIAMGFKFYFKDKSNVFDFIVIAISTVDLILNNIRIQSVGLGALRALRIFRLLRVFKLAKVWKSFSQMLSTIQAAMSKVSYFVILVALFWFTYSIVGKELYAYKVSFSESDAPLSQDFDFKTGKFKQGFPPDFNFNTFWESSVTVFMLIANGSWSGVFYRYMRAPDVPQLMGIVYFYSMIIVGKYILLQLFLAILLNEFDERSIEREAEEAAQLANMKDQTFREQARDVVSRLFGEASCWLRCFVRDKSPDAKSDSEQENAKKEAGDQQGGSHRSDSNELASDKSLGCLTRQNPLRRLCLYLGDAQSGKAAKLDSVIWICIGISIITLGFESPLLDVNSRLVKIVEYVDRVTTVIFILELMIKVIAFGLLFNGKNSYLRIKANWVDLFVVTSSIVNFVIQSDIGFVKIIRIAKLARPLKLFFRNEMLRISIKALGKGMKQIFNLFLLVILIYVIFGIIAINFFKGTLYDCQTGASQGLSIQTDAYAIRDIYDCLNYGGQWVQIGQNFDNFGNAFSQMFIMAQAVTWDAVMLSVMKSQGVYQDQIRYAPYGKSLLGTIFFMCWIVFGSFFIQNLFVGVVISEYNRQSEKLGKNFLLTEDQKNWIETKLMLTKIKPKVLPEPPKNKCRQFFFHIVSGDENEPRVFKRLNMIFESTMMVTICINTVLLCVKWPNMSSETTFWIDLINYICTGIFILEAFIKLFGLGLQYFKDGWNIFDFVIVLGSISFISPTFKKQKNGVTIIRAFKVGRVFKLFGKLKQLQSIWKTVLNTLPALMNVGLLMLLIIYMFAVVGVQYFGAIKLAAPMHGLYNFSTLPKAFLTLFTVATGDSWNSLLVSMEQDRSILNDCIEDPSYDDYVENGFESVGCGSRFATTYLFTFSFLISLVFINLFVAIILQGYFSNIQKDKGQKVFQNIEKFKTAWSKYDRRGTGVIANEDLPNLLFMLGKPLGWGPSYKVPGTKRQLYIENLSKNMEKHQESQDKSYFFEEVLDNLMLFYVIKQQVKLQMEKYGCDYCSSDEEHLHKNSAIQSQIDHLEEGLNQKDALLVRQLQQNSSARRQSTGGAAVEPRSATLTRSPGLNVEELPEAHSEESKGQHILDESPQQQHNPENEPLREMDSPQIVRGSPEQVIHGGMPSLVVSQSQGILGSHESQVHYESS